MLAALGPERFADGLAARAGRLEQALLRVAAARARDAAAPPAAATGLREWSALDVEARRRLIADVIDYAFVRAGVYDADERVTVCARGTAPVDLPRPGIHVHELKAFAPRDAEATPRPPHPLRAWPAQRLHSEVAAAVAGHDAWPAFGHFDAIGRSDLRTQLIFQGGPLYWAHRLGLPYCTVWPATQTWSEDRLRATLALAVHKGERFPSYAELATLGLDTATEKIRGSGGTKRWAREFDAPIRPLATKGRWTDEAIEHAMTELTAGRATYPSATEFRDAGLAGLHVTIQRSVGHPWWAYHLGLPRQRPR